MVKKDKPEAEEWEKRFNELWDTLPTDPTNPARFHLIKGFIQSEKQKSFNEGYKKGIKDEIECVETSGEHLGLQKLLKKSREELVKRIEGLARKSLDFSRRENRKFIDDVLSILRQEKNEKKRITKKVV